MRLIRVHELTPEELKTVTNLHNQVLRESFINNFGLNFLKLTYIGLVSNPSNIFLLIKDNEKTVGFLIATTNGSLFTKKFLILYLFPLIKEVLISSLKNPLQLYRLIQWFFAIPLFNNQPELQFFAISPDYQRMGLGTKLNKLLIQEFQALNIPKYLVGTKANNEQSNNFYIKSKFKFFEQRKLFGDQFNFYFSPNIPVSNHIPHKPNYYYPLFIITSIFLLLFIFKSNINMLYTPFYDFDEAHRAENAKEMKINKSYFVPLTGSSFDRVESLRIPVPDNPVAHLYYHLERPFLVYLSMILTTSIFGDFLGSVEWAYRLPSFIFGVTTFLVFYIFCKKISSKDQLFSNHQNTFAFFVGLLTMMTSADLWLSSQYAQMDTGLMLFIFISLVSLIVFCQNKKERYLILSGLSFGLSVLSKGQPSIIFIFPVIFLFLIRKLFLKEVLKLIGYTSILLIPWIAYLSLKFGFIQVVTIFSGFAIYSASIIYDHNVAPFFWYARWWWESLRPGWSLFLALLFYEIINRKITWEKATLLSYIIGGFIAFSIPINKLWWYVLPLVPAISFYIFLSIKDFLKTNPHKNLNIIIVTLISSLPIFLKVTNTISIIYGLIITFFVFLVLSSNITPKNFTSKMIVNLFICTLLLSFLWFSLNFPRITPYHWNTKAIATYYKDLPGKKCLWVYDMPAEAALFYSDAKEITVYNENSIIPHHCKNYLISPISTKHPLLQNKKLLIRKGHMKLFEI